MEVALGHQPAVLLQQGREAPARRAQRHGGLDRDGGLGLQPLADRADRGIERAPVGVRAVVDAQRRNGGHEVGAGADGVRRARGRPQAPGVDSFLQRLVEPGLAGERGRAGVDLVDDLRVDVAADDVVPRSGDLRGERQADLAERDDDRPHAATSTVSPVWALRSTLSAHTTVARPSFSFSGKQYLKKDYAALIPPDPEPEPKR